LEELLQRKYRDNTRRLVLWQRQLTLVVESQFVEYDPRAHRLDTLASFSYFVSSM
jgi:hypothetical protein